MSKKIVDNVHLPVVMSYQFDNFLLHLIQEVTKRSSADILNFFNELAKQVATIGTEQRKGEGIRKNIKDYFPGTSIPFHMLVKGWKGYNYRTPHHNLERDEYMSCTVEVGFPVDRMYIQAKKLDDIAVGLMEQVMLGGEPVNIPPFERPAIKTPKMYEPLMASFTGRVFPESKKKKKKEINNG